MRGALYWILAAVMIAFGLLAILSIGGPFLLIGCTLVILAPSRRRPIVLATVLAAEIGLVIGYLLVVPLSCVTRYADGPNHVNSSGTSCSNLLGIDYRGAAGYEPSLIPAVIAAVVAALLAGLVTWFLMRRATETGGISI